MTDQEMLQAIFEKIQTMDEHLNKIDTELKEVKADVREVKFTLENETNKQIQIIAEGHLNLDRKLNAALTLDTEKEVMQIRILNLESKVRQLEAKITQSA